MLESFSARSLAADSLELCFILMFHFEYSFFSTYGIKRVQTFGQLWDCLHPFLHQNYFMGLSASISAPKLFFTLLLKVDEVKLLYILICEY
ncbi:hypothetical protein LIER_00855 [Lithospermum erythrorhizon]|uniref:Uncharacterized protein n=1 Tax=Lithospermum erythrorhizon TaxID=34254 RepID=A0AAV3NK10_LITER